MRFLIFLFSGMIAFGTGCGPSESDTRMAKLEDEVLALHDVVMEKDDDANRLGRSLKSYKDSLSAAGNDERLPEVIDAIIRLREAQDAMRAWMDHFERPRDVGDDSLAVFFAQQKEIMAGIGDLYLKSMAKAEELLRQQ